MTLQQFDAELKTVTANTYELSAPKGVMNCIVWHRYMQEPVIGDNAQQCFAWRIQIDVMWQSLNNDLAQQVMQKLSALQLPYELIDYGYDDEYGCMRAIMQLTVI